MLLLQLISSIKPLSHTIPILRYQDPGDQNFNRVISDIFVVLRYRCTVRREIFEVAMVKFINIKKRRDLTADLKVMMDTGALND